MIKIPSNVKIAKLIFFLSLLSKEDVKINPKLNRISLNSLFLRAKKKFISFSFLE